MSTAYQDRYWSSADGLKLHFRDYPGRDDRPPVLCLHGLTRNARDFAGLAQHLAGEWRVRSEEHTSELQSLMRISYAVFCLKKKKQYIVRLCTYKNVNIF